MTNNGLIATIEFTSADAASRLGLTEQEFRVAAKRIGLSAPFSEADLRQITAELNPAAPQSHGEIIEAGERFEDAIAPLDVNPSDLYNAARSAFKRALVQRLKADYNSIESEAITEILGNE